MNFKTPGIKLCYDLLFLLLLKLSQHHLYNLQNFNNKLILTAMFMLEEKELIQHTSVWRNGEPEHTKGKWVGYI